MTGSSFGEGLVMEDPIGYLWPCMRELLHLMKLTGGQTTQLTLAEPVGLLAVCWELRTLRPIAQQRRLE
jgi:hypothetical protein